MPDAPTRPVPKFASPLYPTWPGLTIDVEPGGWVTVLTLNPGVANDVAVLLTDTPAG